jgi:hypothetical protein
VCQCHASNYSRHHLIIIITVTITMRRLTRFKVIYMCICVKKQSSVFLKYLLVITKYRTRSNGDKNALAVESVTAKTIKSR